MSNHESSALLKVGESRYAYYPVSSVEGSDRLPLALKVLVENVLRKSPTEGEGKAAAKRIVEAGLAGKRGEEIEFSPARVLFQDFTGVPVFVDFAAMREACEALGGDPALINPQIPCDLVIDHSVIADEAGMSSALRDNMDLEFHRNSERYTFLKWAQASFENVRIVPPGRGICHQLNIEVFAPVVMDSSSSHEADHSGDLLVYFDTLVGTDSHTPTVNGIGVLGWGVGGIEAEAAALGQPITTLVPQVIGVRLTGRLKPGIEAMDVALTFAHMLRAKGVVGCFVECFGEGVEALSATQRACIANMTPEYGCTCTLFPVDNRTLEYLRLTGRSDEHVALVEAYAKAQGFWGSSGSHRVYADILSLDLSTVTPSVAGPSRPHDLIVLRDVETRFSSLCSERNLPVRVREVEAKGETYELTHGTIAIAAVTSCTTATDPEMMLAAGLLARNARSRGLRPKPWVKTILAPGSRATELLLERAGLIEPLRDIGFYTCGFGCMSCIGNSGAILPALHDVANEIELASVLSGNRNFEGRISPDVSQNYLTAPLYVIAYALVGTMAVDITREVLGTDAEGNAVYLKDILPDPEELASLIATCVNSELYAEGAKGLYEGDAAWQALSASPSNTYTWDDSSTYVRRPPYFEGMTLTPQRLKPIETAWVLGRFGDFITTDHISPAGAIAPDSPAALYLEAKGVSPADFNTYGARRGNHEVMMRGTFANVKLQNELAEGKRGGFTKNLINGFIEPIYNVSQDYADAKKDLMVVAGLMYGSGSSRDWAAKGPMLLGVRAVIAQSYERIHRSNLIGMGILPLQFMEGESAESLGITGEESISIEAIDFSAGLPSPAEVRVILQPKGGVEPVVFQAKVRVDTPTEGRYYANGGILPFVLRQLIAR